MLTYRLDKCLEESNVEPSRAGHFALWSDATLLIVINIFLRDTFTPD